MIVSTLVILVKFKTCIHITSTGDIVKTPTQPQLNHNLGSIQKSCDPLRGGEGVTKKITKYHRGGRVDHKKITEDHDHKGGCKYMAKLNNYSQDQLCSYAPIEIFWHPPPKKFRKHATSPKILELWAISFMLSCFTEF